MIQRKNLRDAEARAENIVSYSIRIFLQVFQGM